MSYIPNANLPPVNSFFLQTYQVTEPLTEKIYDTFSMYQAFWKSIVIRNFGTTDVKYKNQIGDQEQTIPPAAERTLVGWGSYFEVTDDGDGKGTVILELVNWESMKNARRD